MTPNDYLKIIALIAYGAMVVMPIFVAIGMKKK